MPITALLSDGGIHHARCLLLPWVRDNRRLTIPVRTNTNCLRKISCSDLALEELIELVVAPTGYLFSVNWRHEPRDRKRTSGTKQYMPTTPTKAVPKKKYPVFKTQSAIMIGVTKLVNTLTGFSTTYLTAMDLIRTRRKLSWRLQSQLSSLSTAESKPRQYMPNLSDHKRTHKRKSTNRKGRRERLRG